MLRLDDLKISPIDFIDFPKEIAIEKYIREKQNLVNYFKNHPAVKSIYEMGGINDPGISDLDLILIVKEKIMLSRNDHKLLQSLDKNIFVHPPFAIPESLFPYVNYFFFASNIHVLSEKEYSILSFASESEKIQLSWILSAEAALSRLCDIIYQITCHNNISIRKMLLKLNSIKHNIALAERLKVQHVNYDKFSTQITELRKEWFLLREDQQIIRITDLLNKGLWILKSILSAMAKLFEGTFRESILLRSNKELAYYILPNSMQALIFHASNDVRTNIVHNPFSFVQKVGSKFTQKLARHFNDISYVSIPVELSCLFLHNNAILPGLLRMMSENFINMDGIRKNEYLHGVFERRLNLICIYNKFFIENGLSGMSLLLLAPWLIARRAKLYGIKSILLRAILRLKPV